MGDVISLIVRRLVSSIAVLALLMTIVFFFMRFAGNPILTIVGNEASDDEIAAAEERLGLDKSPIEQFVVFVGGVLQGEFGTSFRYNEPAMPVVLSRLPATLRLVAVALVLSVVVAIPIGIFSALKPGSWVDNLSRIGAVLGQSMPIFWLGILLIIAFAVNLGILPAGGREGWKSLVLPSVTLSVYSIPLMMRLVRSSMLDVLGQDYVRTARAKGLSERDVILIHALPNAAIPVITVIALRVGSIVAGTVVLELVFAYPGMGRLAIDSMLQLDYAVIQSFIFLTAVIVLTLNLVVDILYGLVDPRVRVS